MSMSLKTTIGIMNEESLNGFYHLNIDVENE